MSYDLAFWVGTTPRTDEEALTTFEELMDELEEGPESPPLPPIRSLADALEARWPDLDDSPWASWPLEVNGSLLYANLSFGRPDSDLEFMAACARRLGIVCFDPQSESVL